MYEELISRLKNLATLTTENGESEILVSAEAVQAIREIATQAADAIEELQSRNNELLFRCGQAEALIDYYQTGELPSNKPQKEET